MAMQNDNPWRGAYKIPWDDPQFSWRMLREHLSQDHDMASRRFEWIDRQVAWIHEDLLAGHPADVLDLGCGPGFYSHRLGVLGHRCHGIDFSPASIEYAKQHCPDQSRCTFDPANLLDADFGGPYDLVMFLFGEFNVFPPADAMTILRKVWSSLRREGRLILEIQTCDAVEQAGHREPSEEQYESGLFSDQPYRCRTESRWLAGEKVAVDTFSVTETGTNRTCVHRSTTQAWPEQDLTELLLDAGFKEAAPCDQWPCNTDALQLWIAE